MLGFTDMLLPFDFFKSKGSNIFRAQRGNFERIIDMGQ